MILSIRVIFLKDKCSAVYPYTYTCLKRGLGGSVREGRREGRAHVGGECGVSVCASVRCCVRVDQGAGVSTGERETVCFRPTRIGPIIKSNPVRRINTCIPNRAATVCPVAGARAAWGSFLFGDMDDSEILDYGSDDGAGEAKQGGKHDRGAGNDLKGAVPRTCDYCGEHFPSGTQLFAHLATTAGVDPHPAKGGKRKRNPAKGVGPKGAATSLPATAAPHSVGGGAREAGAARDSRAVRGSTHATDRGEVEPGAKPSEQRGQQSAASGRALQPRTPHTASRVGVGAAAPTRDAGTSSSGVADLIAELEHRFEYRLVLLQQQLQWPSSCDFALANIDRSLEALRQCSEQFDKHGIREPGSADAGAEVFARVERVCRARSASSADYSSTVAVETEALHFLSLRRTEEELVDMAWLYILDAVPGAVSDEASRRQRLVKRMTVHSIRWGAVSEDRSGDDWSGGLPTPLEKSC